MSTRNFSLKIAAILAAPDKWRLIKHTPHELLRAIEWAERTLAAVKHEIAEEMGQNIDAAAASVPLPSSSASPTGEQEGPTAVAAEANVTLPPASPASLDDVGHTDDAGNGQVAFAPSSTPKAKAGKGHLHHAGNGRAAAAPPALAPTAAQRAGAARGMAAAATATAKTILDTLKIGGGARMAIGDVRYTALLVMRDTSEFEAALFQEIISIGKPDNLSDRVRDYLSPQAVEAAYSAAKRRFHNVAAA